MFVKARYFLLGAGDIWCVSNETKTLLCHTMDGKTLIYPPDDPSRVARLQGIHDLGQHIADLILPHTILMRTNNINIVAMVQSTLTDACIMVPLDDDATQLPVEVSVVWHTIKSYDLLRPYLAIDETKERNTMLLTEEVYTHLKMAL
jgi:hypothetical protein